MKTIIQLLHSSLHWMRSPNTGRKAVLTALLLLIVSFPSKAYFIDWVLHGKQQNFNAPKAVFCKKDGGVLIVGDISNLNGGTLHFSNAPVLSTRGQTDAFVVSMQADARVNWIKQIGGTNFDNATDVVADSAGNVYVSGLFRDSLWIDNMHLICKGLPDIFFAKFDVAGKLLWLKQIKSQGTAYYSKLAADNNGNIYVAGAFPSDTDFGDSVLHMFQGGSSANFPKDAFLCKYDSQGSLLWTKVFQSPATEEITSITVAANGDVYACGSFIDSLAFDGFMKTSQGQEDIFLVKLSPSGSLKWVKTYGDSQGDIPTKIVMYKGEQVFMTASYENAITMNGTTFRCAAWDAHNLLLARIDSSGNPSWAKSYAVQLNQAVADINEQGVISFSGGFLLQAFLDNFSLSSFDPGYFDVFVAVCDSNGSVHKVFHGIEGQHDEHMWDLDMDDSGNIYAAGIASGEVKWDEVLVPLNLFVLKIQRDPKPNSVSNQALPVFHLYPNPTQGRIAWSGEEPVTGVKVFDMLGRLLISEDEEQASGVDLSKLNTGSYLLQINTLKGNIQHVVIKR